MYLAMRRVVTEAAQSRSCVSLQTRSFSCSRPHSNGSPSSKTLPSFNPSASFRVTQPPNPTWQLGEGLSKETSLGKSWKTDEGLGWKSWKTSEFQGRDLYRLLTSAVTPRPIAFVSTLSPDGSRNLAPMSYFTVISHNPPLLIVSFSLSPRKPKDSRENILKTKQFTVNIISEPFVEAANMCSIEAPSDVDEWVVSGLTPVPSNQVAPPRVKESAVGIECELYEHKDFFPENGTEPSTTLVFGLIKEIHVRKAVLADDQQTVDPARLRPVARLGGNTFSRLGEGFDLPRPSWKALKERIRNMQQS